MARAWNIVASIGRRVGIALVALIGALPLAATAQTVDDATALRQVFDEYWNWAKRELPEISTFLGEERYNDRLADLSPDAIARRKTYVRTLVERLQRFDASKLPGQDAVSLGILRTKLEAQVRLDAFPVERLQISPTGGPQIDFAFLVKSTPFRKATDYDAYLERLHALPRQLRQIEALMREGVKSRWIYPAVAIQRVPGQIDAWLSTDIAQNPAFRPFAEFPVEIGDAERARLADAGRRAVAADVVPAFRALKQFVEKEYLPNARKELGAATLPGGAPYYDALIAQQTTTTLTAREIHEIGLREVARIGAEMDAVMRGTGFTGTRPEFFAWLRDAPQFYFTRADDMLVAYRDLAKRVDAQLPKLFFELPRLPYGIRAMEAFEGDNAEHYTPGSPQVGRAGFFEANANNLKTRPKYDMENLFLHEAVPGHHLQIARAQELSGLPEFRQHGFFVAYVEGWALYAESLGAELGLYTDPYARFGRLSWEMVRACRLVVDTGIHAFGWERSRAIDYLIAESGLNEAFATAEVDRYIVGPGQALGYKLGELKIKALRAKATDALRERFDIRRFHNALIDDGALPLAVLEQRIDQWIAREASRPPASAATAATR
jgi:uncharacterized protein (DUF885 family)